MNASVRPSGDTLGAVRDRDVVAIEAAAEQLARVIVAATTAAAAASDQLRRLLGAGAVGEEASIGSAVDDDVDGAVAVGERDRAKWERAGRVLAAGCGRQRRGDAGVIERR